MFYRARFGSPMFRFIPQYDELDRMRRQMDRLFEAFGDQPSGYRSAGVFPAINLTEDVGNYYVRAELPGIKSEDLDIQMTHNNLSITGERKFEPAGSGAKYHRREREAGKFSRAVSMPGEVSAEGVKASLVNGVLTVTIPKAEKAKPRQITVQ
jgi:HSP20 family protein